MLSKFPARIFSLRGFLGRFSFLASVWPHFSLFPAQLCHFSEYYHLIILFVRLAPFFTGSLSCVFSLNVRLEQLYRDRLCGDISQ